MITVKSGSELELMREAGKLLADTLGSLEEACQPGVTTNEIDTIADKIIRGNGAIPGFLGYNGFPKSLCISVNEEVVHGIPGKREIKDGDLVSLDCGLILDGLWADSGRTVMVGNVSEEAKRLVEVTRESLDRGIEQAIPGNRVGDISAAVQRPLRANGFSVLCTLLGPGSRRT